MLRPLLPVLSRSLTLLETQPAAVSLAVLALVAYISLLVLGVLRRMLAFWVRLVSRLMLVGVLVVGASVVAQRGVHRTFVDVAAWAEELVAVWSSEYGRYEGLRKHEGKRW